MSNRARPRDGPLFIAISPTAAFYGADGRPGRVPRLRDLERGSAAGEAVTQIASSLIRRSGGGWKSYGVVRIRGEPPVRGGYLQICRVSRPVSEYTDRREHAKAPDDQTTRGERREFSIVKIHMSFRGGDIIFSAARRLWSTRETVLRID